MTPIEYLQSHGYDPDNFRTADVQRPAFRNSPLKHINTGGQVRTSKRVHKKRVPSRRHLDDVRAELYAKWFADEEQELIGLFLPYIMLDQMQIICSEKLSKADFRHKEKYHYTQMMQYYHRFNNLFFQRLSEERRDKAVDMMDAFGEYIHNHLEIFRFNIIGCVMELDSDFRDLCGALCCCKLMVSHARRAWDGMYKSQDLKFDTPTKLLAQIEHHCIELLNEFFKRENRLQEDVNLSTVDTVRRAEENVVKKILEFLKEYENCNKELS